MELLQLKYFLQLAKTQHVSKTADMLNISQPSLSSTLKKLEAELGVPLFVRQGRNIELSEYGKVYRDYIEEAFWAMENGKRAIDTMREHSEGSINLGVLSPYVWTEIFNAFDAKYPDISLNRYSVEGYRYISDILDGKIDLYLGALNEIENQENRKIQYQTLYEDDMVLLVNDAHPLAKYDEIDLSSCRDENFINLDDETSLQQFVSVLYQKAGFKPKVKMVCDYTLRDRMVSENHGIMVTTRLSALKCDYSNVKFLTITNPSEKRKLGIVWRKNMVFSSAMKKFIDFAGEFYTNL